MQKTDQEENFSPHFALLFDNELEKTRSIRPKEGDVPFRSYPTSFGKDYVLPQHRDRALAKANPIAIFDKNITFYEEDHLYVCHGRVASASVSGLAKPFKENFNKNAILPTMMCSKHFPKLEYALNAILVEDINELEPTTQIVMHNVVADEHVYTGSYGGAPPICNDGECFFTYERAMTRDEICAKWDDPRGRNKGVEGHLAMETFFSGEPVWQSKELLTGLVFVREIMAKLDIVGHRCEFEIFAPEEDLAGSVDFLGKTKGSETYHIFDWKRAKKLNQIKPKYAKKMFAPFNHIVVSDVSIYSFQVSAYMWIIEKYAKLRVESLALVSILPGMPWWTFCPYMEVEVEWIMRKRREMVAARITVAVLRPDLPRCAISGDVAYDAVKEVSESKDDNLRIFNEKWHKKYRSMLGQVEEDKETRHIVSQVLQSVQLVVLSKEEKNLQEKKVKFLDRMPASGIQTFTPCRSF